MPRTFKPNGRVTSASLNRHHEFDLAIRWNRRYRLEKNAVLTYVVARTFNFVTLAIELEFQPEWIPERKTGVPPPLVPNRIVVEGSQCSSKLAKSGLAKFRIAKSPRLHRIDTRRRRQVQAKRRCQGRARRAGGHTADMAGLVVVSLGSRLAFAAANPANSRVRYSWTGLIGHPMHFRVHFRKVLLTLAQTL